jgi:PAS domain S-box-containing protein
MSLLDESRTEERVSHLRSAIVIVVALAALWAFVRGQLDGTPALSTFVFLSVGLAAPLVTLSISRTRIPPPRLVFLNNGIDISVMSGVLVASLYANDSTLSMAAQLGYLLMVAVSGLRFHLASSLFASGFAALQVIAVAIHLLLMSTPPSFTQVSGLVLLAVVLALAGGLVVALVLGARRSVASFDEVERIHRRVLNQVSDGLLVCNSVGRIVDVNAAASEVLGLPRGVLVDLEAFTALPGPLAKELERRWQETLAEGFVLVENLRFERREETCSLDVAAYRVRYRGNDVVQIVLRDTTAEQRLLDQSLQNDRLESLRSLAGGIAHEFNNMFASIEASSYVLAEAIPETAPETVEVEIIRSAAARAAGLVRELRDLTDMRKPQAVPLDVPSLIERALATGQGDGSVEVVAQIAPNVKRLLGDDGQIVRALANLIGCAHGSMLDGGTLTIRAENVLVEESREELVAGEYVSIRIEDTGIGLPADMVARAFDPFFANDGGRWTGFALANVRAVVSRHGGTVELVSNLGRGTVYTLRLPATDRPAVRGSTPLAPRAMGSKKARLLVVDDEAANRNSLARLLSTRGYEVVLAEDGRHAIEACEQCKGQFDLVLLDLVMPGLNGKDVVVALRARYPDIRVLLVTGFADQQLLEEALEVGASSCATKPFDVPQLLGQIQELTEGPGRKESERPAGLN